MGAPKEDASDEKVLVGPGTRMRMSSVAALVIGALSLGAGGAKLLNDVDTLKKGQQTTNALLKGGFVSNDRMNLYVLYLRNSNHGNQVNFPDFPPPPIDDGRDDSR